MLAAPGRVEMTTIDLPPLDATDVRVRVEGCGVCGSNLPVWQGRPWFDYPLPPGAPGHEAWGEVAAVGHAVEGCRVGDRVAFLGDRSFADVADADADGVVVLPPELAGSDFPGEALGCAVNVAARSGFAPGQTVAVVGVGFLGAGVVAMAALAGATVIGVSRRPFSLDVARAMGAHHVVELSDADAVVRGVERVAGGLCDVVVEAVGAQQPLDVATKLTKERGRLVIAGFHQDGPRTVDLQLWNWRGIDVVNAHERSPAVYRRGIEQAAALVASGAIDPAPLYTHRFPLDRLGAAMAVMDTRPDGFLKALVTT